MFPNTSFTRDLRTGLQLTLMKIYSVLLCDARKNNWTEDLSRFYVACRDTQLKMYEIGAVVLSSIPPAVAGGQLLQLPRIMASCDAVIRDGNTGSAVRIVEAKHRCPFAPPSNKRPGFTFLGRRKGPQLQTTGSGEAQQRCQGHQISESWHWQTGEI